MTVNELAERYSEEDVEKRKDYFVVINMDDVVEQYVVNGVHFDDVNKQLIIETTARSLL